MLPSFAPAAKEYSPNSMVSSLDSQPLSEVFESHQICKEQRSLRTAQILATYSEYIDKSSFTSWHLCLHRFVTTKPLGFVRRSTIDTALEFFSEYPNLTLAGICALGSELTHAMFSMMRKGASWGREEMMTLDRPKEMAEFDGIWHPEYQRYCEHVFNHLLQLPLHILSSRKGKNYTQLRLPLRVKCMEANGLSELTTGYSSVVRNAISHGRADFQMGGVRYADEKTEAFLTCGDFAKIFDDLVDTCHSIVVALLLFLCRHQTLVEQVRLRALPLGIRFMFVDTCSSHGGFQLLSAMESTISGGQSQLNLVCQIDTRSRWVQLFETMHTCWNASRFGGEAYSRFFVSLDCGMPVVASLILDGQRLHQAINGGEAFGQCASQIVDTSLLWYDASRWESTLYFWRNLLSTRWQAMKSEIIERWREGGLKVLSSRYVILWRLNRSSGSVRKLEAHMVLDQEGTVTDELLQDIVRHSVARLRTHRVRRTGLCGEKGIGGRPDYVLIRLYAQEARLRTLLSKSWKDHDLILIAEWISSPRKMQPFYTRDADATVGRTRIKYNPNLRRKEEC